MVFRFSNGKSFVKTTTPLSYTSVYSEAITCDIDSSIFDTDALEEKIVSNLIALYEQSGSINWTIYGYKDDGTTLIGAWKVTPTAIDVAMHSSTASAEESTYMKWFGKALSEYIPEILIKSALMAGISATVASPSTPKCDSTDSSDELSKLIEEITSKTKADISKPNKTMDDYVCGELLREEFLEIIDFFENESVYKDAGIEIPKGILFKGVPGTGKTYAAQCLAGSTDSYFMSCTASALQGMYIGSGAENIRAVFKGAKQLREKSGKGVYLFIDEIDSFGNRDNRSGGAGGEEDRTLNQLLAEMSGFTDIDGIIVLAATNYADRLDDALMRSGRFSRQITIDKPDTAERESMVKYYFDKIKYPLDDTSYEDVAQLTKGLTPADIKEIVNEAAILTVRQKLSNITLENINEAVNKVITKNIRTPDDKLNTEMVAGHEAGHVLAEVLYANSVPIKVTNYSYGNAGGFTQPGSYLEGIVNKDRHIAEIKILLGGRAAEQVLFGEITNGASNDLDRAKAHLKRYYAKYHFEKYMAKDLDQIILDKLHSIYEEVIADYELEENQNMLRKLTSEITDSRVLYAKDITAICSTIILKGDII